MIFVITILILVKFYHLASIFFQIKKKFQAKEFQQTVIMEDILAQIQYILNINANLGTD